MSCSKIAEQDMEGAFKETLAHIFTSVGRNIRHCKVGATKGVYEADRLEFIIYRQLIEDSFTPWAAKLVSRHLVRRYMGRTQMEKIIIAAVQEVWDSMRGSF